MQSQINIYWKRSTNLQKDAEGDRFFVSANLNEEFGWLVKTANVRSGGSGVGDLDDATEIKDENSTDEENGEDKD